LHIRPILVRSARVTPIVLERFHDQRRDQLRLVIRYLREGKRVMALDTWRVFVDGLADYPEPVDLDEVMMYVTREGCAHGNGAFEFHAGRLEYLQNMREQVEDYEDSLNEQLDLCQRHIRPCSLDTMRRIETELVRTQAEIETLAMRERVANDEFEAVLESSREYEMQFASTFEDIYHEVELRVTFSP